MSALEAGLADFALRTRWSDLPPTIQQRTIDLFIDAIACAYTGRDAAGRAAFASAAAELTGAGSATVIADVPRASLLGGGMLNAWQVTATTMCDVYRPAMCHVTPIVLAAVLAGADHGPTRLGDLLAAFAVGVEVTLRLCAAMDGSFYRGPRWHAPGVIGPFGSAAVYARLTGLEAPELQRAWGAALLHSAGTFSAIGTPGVKLTQARGAAAGLQAIVFARAGHGGSPDALVHPDGGLFDAYAGADPESVLRDLGTTWLSPELSLRQWPASSSLQSLIAAVLDLRAAEGPDEGASLVIDLPPQSYKLCAQMPWDSQLNALQSAAWVAGAAWVDGRCWLDQFEGVGLRNESRNAVAGRVRVAVDPQLPEGAARVRTGQGGNPVTRLHAPGSPADPLGAEAIRAKFILAAGEARAADLTARVTGDPAGDSADLMAIFRLED